MAAGGLLARRPFRAPHHTISQAALIGGGQSPRPGEVSLAHNGVLFLDELPEFGRSVLEVLRQPLEEKRVTVSRAKYSVEYPANFTLVADVYKRQVRTGGTAATGEFICHCALPALCLR